MQPPTYRPAIFDEKTVEGAKRIILTVPEDIQDDYWERSTRATVDVMTSAMTLGAADVVLDFGCGIGRIARELIGRTACRVVGVDISADMRRHAVDYVASDRFSTMSSEEFARLAERGTIMFSAAYTIIVLQHVLDPRTEIRRIRAMCQIDAPFLAYNCVSRCVPTTQGWSDDRKDVGAIIDRTFEFRRQIATPRELMFYPDRGPAFPGEEQSHWFRLYRKRM